MNESKNKTEIDALWKKYQTVLVRLNDALEQLSKKPKEVIKEVEKVVEIEQIKEVPVTEFVEVPKIVEVEVVKELTAEQKAFYESRIAELEDQVKSLQSQTPNIDYWGRPKNISKKLVTDVEYEQKLEQKYARIVEEIKKGKLDINTLTTAEQVIVQKYLNDQ